MIGFSNNNNSSDKIKCYQVDTNNGLHLLTLIDVSKKPVIVLVNQSFDTETVKTTTDTSGKNETLYGIMCQIRYSLFQVFIFLLILTCMCFMCFKHT